MPVDLLAQPAPRDLLADHGPRDLLAEPESIRSPMPPIQPGDFPAPEGSEDTSRRALATSRASQVAATLPHDDPAIAIPSVQDFASQNTQASLDAIARADAGRPDSPSFTRVDPAQAQGQAMAEAFMARQAAQTGTGSVQAGVGRAPGHDRFFPTETPPMEHRGDVPPYYGPITPENAPFGGYAAEGTLRTLPSQSTAYPATIAGDLASAGLGAGRIAGALQGQIPGLDPNADAAYKTASDALHGWETRQQAGADPLITHGAHIVAGIAPTLVAGPLGLEMAAGQMAGSGFDQAIQNGYTPAQATAIAGGLGAVGAVGGKLMGSALPNTGSAVGNFALRQAVGGGLMQAQNTASNLIQGQPAFQGAGETAVLGGLMNAPHALGEAVRAGQPDAVSRETPRPEPVIDRLAYPPGAEPNIPAHRDLLGGFGDKLPPGAGPEIPGNKTLAQAPIPLATEPRQAAPYPLGTEPRPTPYDVSQPRPEPLGIPGELAVPTPSKPAKPTYSAARPPAPDMVTGDGNAASYHGADAQAKANAYADSLRATLARDPSKGGVPGARVDVNPMLGGAGYSVSISHEPSQAQRPPVDLLAPQPHPQEPPHGQEAQDQVSQPVNATPQAPDVAPEQRPGPVQPQGSAPGVHQADVGAEVKATHVLPPGEITPLHGVKDFNKLGHLKESMRDDGWIGRPLLAMETDDGIQALTGSHRLAAADQAGIDVPVHVLPKTGLEAANIDPDFLKATDDEDKLYKLQRAGFTDAASLMRTELAPRDLLAPVQSDDVSPQQGQGEAGSSGQPPATGAVDQARGAGGVQPDVRPVQGEGQRPEVPGNAPAVQGAREPAAVPGNNPQASPAMQLHSGLAWLMGGENPLEGVNPRVIARSLAGHDLPALSEHDQPTADHFVRHASSLIASPLIARDFAAQVLGDRYRDSSFSNKVGAVLTEDNLRSIRQDFQKKSSGAATPEEAQDFADKAAAVKSLVGNKRPFATEGEYQTALKDPEVKAAVDRFKTTVNPWMDEQYRTLQKIDPATPLPSRGVDTGARINLKGAERDVAPGAGGAGTPTNVRLQKSKFGRQASGSGEYDTDLNNILANSVSQPWAQATKARAIQSLAESGGAKILPQGETGPDGWKTYELEKGRMILQDGKSFSQPGKTLWVRPDLYKEVRGALNLDDPIKRAWLAHMLNRIQLTGPTDAAWHAANITSAVTNAPGASNIMADLGRKAPGVNVVDALSRIGASASDVMKDSPEIRARLARLATEGMLRGDTASHGITGGMLQTLDQAGRVTMDKMFDNLVARGLAQDSTANRRNFVNQLGQYNSRLAPQLFRAMKQSGLAPFATAGTTFNRLGVRALTGSPGFTATSTRAALTARAVQLAGPLLGTFAAAAAANYLMSGSVSGRAGVPLGAIDTGKTDDKGKPIYVDLAQWNGVRRGLRVTGIGPAVEALRRGQTGQDAINEATGSVFDSMLHPYLGPALRVGSVATTGLEPSWRHPDMTDPVPPGGSIVGARLKAAAKESSSLVKGAIEGSLPRGSNMKDQASAQAMGALKGAGASMLGAVGVKSGSPVTVGAIQGAELNTFIERAKVQIKNAPGGDRVKAMNDLLRELAPQDRQRAAHELVKALRHAG